MRSNDLYDSGLHLFLDDEANCCARHPGQGQPCPYRHSWATLLARVFRLDVTTCPDCGGLVKPAVIAMGENISPDIWQKSMEAVRSCSIVLAVGSTLAVSSAAALIAEARRNDATLIFITLGAVNTPVFPDDICINLPAERVLPAMLKLLR